MKSDDPESGTLPEPKIANTLSQGFLEHVKQLFEMSFLIKRTMWRREGDNLHTEFAIPAYISAASAIESYVNEIFLSDLMMKSLPDGPIKQLKKADFERAEKMELQNKITLMPLLTYAKTLDREKNPFLDVCHLINLRNGLAHFKLKFGEGGVSKAINDLTTRKIIFSDERSGPVCPLPLGEPISTWHERVSTTEGIRWAHNCVVDTFHELIDLHPGEAYRKFQKDRFAKIPDTETDKQMSLHGWK